MASKPLLIVSTKDETYYNVIIFIMASLMTTQQGIQEM